jgi:putative transposase
MRPYQRTLKASTVYAYGRHLLQQTLEVERFQPAIPLKVVVSVLLLACCWQTSLTGACRLVNAKPSHHHVRQAVYGCLPPRPRDLLQRLLAGLAQTLPEHLFWRAQAMALDLHQRPYYGKKNTRGCTLRKKKASTKKSFTYATLAALDPCGRFTVGLLATRPHMRLCTIIERLLEQAQTLGLSIRYLLLDKEFYSAEVIDLLQRRRIAFLMPAVQKGNNGKGNSWLFAATTAVGWHSYTWTTDLRRMDFKAKKRRKKGKRTVTVPMCVGRYSKEGKEIVAVYATGGLGKGWSPAQVVQTYRKRFGIEASYRQMGQCLARTSSRCERLRLLLVGVALLLCNLWAYLHSELFSSGALGERRLHLDAARLSSLIAAVAAACADALGGWLSEWLTLLPLPHKLTSFQTT